MALPIIFNYFYNFIYPSIEIKTNESSELVEEEPVDVEENSFFHPNRDSSYLTTLKKGESTAIEIFIKLLNNEEKIFTLSNIQYHLLPSKKTKVRWDEEVRVIQIPHKNELAQAKHRDKNGKAFVISCGEGKFRTITIREALWWNGRLYSHNVEEMKSKMPEFRGMYPHLSKEQIVQAASEDCTNALIPVASKTAPLDYKQTKEIETSTAEIRVPEERVSYLSDQLVKAILNGLEKRPPVILPRFKIDKREPKIPFQSLILFHIFRPPIYNIRGPFTTFMAKYITPPALKAPIH